MPNNLDYNGTENNLHTHSSILTDIKIQLVYNSYASDPWFKYHVNLSALKLPLMMLRACVYFPFSKSTLEGIKGS